MNTRRKEALKMYKLKNSYIDRMISNKLTSKEIDFILHIALYQDDIGRVISVYYKDVCAAIGVSNQGFYNILNSLRDKKMISYEKKHRVDIQVILLGNDFSNRNFEQGYLKIAGSNFASKKFRELKAGAKLLYLYMQRFTNGKHMLVQNFYEEFSKIFSIGKKCLQTWLTELKKKFLLFTSVKRNKANNYEMMMKNSTVLHLKKGKVPHEKHTFLKNVEEFIERNFSTKMPKDKREKNKTLRDIAKLTEADRMKKYINFPTFLYRAVEKSFMRQKEEGKKEPALNAALVNICLGEVLEQHIKSKYNIG